MEESHQEATRMGMRNNFGGGEIVEVQGGHIVRSTGRKDRHSKVCTAKGPRDRRVRLSAHTAIQFYDVQDRLGYDRPSKAVDWLIKKAKASIDELAELPAWDPTTAAAATVAVRTKSSTQKSQQEYQFVGDATGSAGGSKSKRRVSNSSMMELYSGCGDIQSMQVNNQNQHQQLEQQQQHEIGGENRSGSDFLPLSLESDPIADTFKSFFPMGTSPEAAATSTVHFENYAAPDLLSRTTGSGQSQDLRLSLQSFQEPMLLPQQKHQQQNEQEVLLSGAGTAANQLGFDGSGWSDHNHYNLSEFSRFQRLVAWNAGDGIDGGGSGSGNGSGNGGIVFNLPPQPQPQQPVLQPLFGQNQFLTQRGPLQSSNTPSIRAWIDPATATDNHYYIQQIHQHHQALLGGVGWTSTTSANGGRFTGFQVPTRIQGAEEEHDGIGMPNKPSSASSDYHH